MLEKPACFRLIVYLGHNKKTITFLILKNIYL